MIIYLVGLSGTGKTSIGRKLSKMLNLQFVDLDALIEKRNKMSVRDIFLYGEDVFRTAEYVALMSIDRNKQKIVATGAGAILTDKNIVFMKESGYVIHIHRNIEKIKTSLSKKHRPLLDEGLDKLYDLYRDRKERYILASDVYFEIDNINAAAVCIADFLKENVL